MNERKRRRKPAMRVELIVGSNLHALRGLADNSIDAVVTDPPYGLSKEPDMAEVLRHWLAGDDYSHDSAGFMGKSWDSFVPGPATWREVYRVLKPGGHVLSFGGTRTYDMSTLAMRLAGFEIRDCLSWMYGSGFPKSMDVSKAIDKAAGAERTVPTGVKPGHESFVGRDGYKSVKGNGAATPEAQQWGGWGTSMKPAYEPIVLARKPLIGTVAANVLTYGTGALNIDATRIDYQGDDDMASATPQGRVTSKESAAIGAEPDAGRDLVRVEFDRPELKGRFPANVILQHSEDCDEDCTPDCPVRLLDEQTGDSGGASRFFYNAKVPKSERNAGMPDGTVNDHPTVKPLALMGWLVKLITPPGGIVLDPFCGSGSTAVAAVKAGFNVIGCDIDPHYIELSAHRLRHAGVEPIITATERPKRKRL